MRHVSIPKFKISLNLKNGYSLGRSHVDYRISIYGFVVPRYLTASPTVPGTLHPRPYVTSSFPSITAHLSLLVFLFHFLTVPGEMKEEIEIQTL